MAAELLELVVVGGVGGVGCTTAKHKVFELRVAVRVQGNDLAVEDPGFAFEVASNLGRQIPERRLRDTSSPLPFSKWASARKPSSFNSKIQLGWSKGRGRRESRMGSQLTSTLRV